MRKPKRQVPEAYRYTTVSAHASRDAIERRLLNYGAEGIMWQSLRTPEQAELQLRFAHRKRTYLFSVKLGQDPQDERQRMRALYWGIKAMVDQAEFGILRLEDLLLAYTQVMLPDGLSTTVANLVQEDLARQAVPSLTTSRPALPARSET